MDTPLKETLEGGIIDCLYYGIVANVCLFGVVCNLQAGVQPVLPDGYRLVLACTNKPVPKGGFFGKTHAVNKGQDVTAKMPKAS